ncbi:hypothetical protein E7T06_07945 [Deinococcus sp. Arct2-2]|uniref:hypothetical protein n=1 Tax=Deinococcus sp. Arct2-2 TaxID=2568653 RepID=UPI0010A34EF2|nr:hypothetical protein [Deinococcus sp. Arct2-2]THF70386.1 hypothetical protein E7T06_07945 [Deinococcus sp. Arct2-2]
MAHDHSPPSQRRHCPSRHPQGPHRELARSGQDPETGRQRRKSVSRPTRAEAEQALAALIRTLPKGSVRRPRHAPVKTLPEPAQPDSLHAFLVRWLAFKKSELRPGTSRKYVIALQPVQEVLGVQPLTELRVLAIEEFIT